MIRRFLWALVVAAIAATAAAAANSPYSIIKETAAELASRIDDQRSDVESDPELLYGVISEVLMPRFDTRYAGYLVLGKENWRSASDEQRDRFIAAFYGFLLRSYADALLEFDQDQITVIQPDSEPQGKKTVVKTEVRLGDGTQIPVNYSMRNTASGWKAYDVRIEGVSYVRNYRNQFAAEIDVKGIDEVIARLEREKPQLKNDAGE